MVRICSSAVLAVLLFFIIDTGVRATYSFWHPSRFTSANRSWIWLAVKDLEQQRRTPDVLLLGSSLMLSVVHDGDATYLHQIQDAVYHHKSSYLEHLLHEKQDKSWHTFSLAVGGQMASDAYAIVSTLFEQSEKPKTVVYGIAPRDFIDSMFLDPASTETYRFMVKAGNTALLATAGHNTFWNCLEQGLSRFCFIYNKRLDLAAVSRQLAAQVLILACCQSNFDLAATPESLQAVIQGNLAEDNKPGRWLVSPYNPAAPVFKNNLPEYRHRYSLFRPKVYQTQIAFFERFLSCCHSKGINVVLINMPLTPENVAILPTGLYQRYLADVSSLSHRYQAKLLDLNQSGLFTHSDFADTVHVNGLGAQRLLNLVADNLTSNLAASSCSVTH